jgi:DNA-binding NarL/FixJ family response regulator
MAKKKAIQPQKRRRVFVIDDHPIVRWGLSQLINEQPDLEMCGQADSPAKAMRLLPAAQADVVSVDLTLRGGDGLDLCKKIRDRFPKLPILVLSMHDEGLYAERALKAGARGYVMKQEPQKSILVALRMVLRGEVYLSTRMSGRILSGLSGPKSIVDSSPLERLTDREFEIFRLVGKGQSVRAIAEELGLSSKTIEAHKEHIKLKLNLKNSNEVLQYAIEAHLSDRY